MTLLHYFIFLGCLLAVNIAVLYTHFLRREMQNFEQIHNRVCIPSLPKAYPLLVSCFLAGAAALFYFTADKTWFIESKFLYFLGLALIFAVLGFIPASKKSGKIIKALLELSGITGFVFITQDNDIFAQKNFLPLAVSGGIALIWFVLFKFLSVLNRFEGLIAAQAFHFGLSSLFILILLSFPFISLLQINGMLCVLIFMLTPFYCVLQYEMPLKGASLNSLNFILTGLLFLMVSTGNWGVGFLMMAYVLFELAVVCFRFTKNLIFRRKNSLFFFEILQERGISNELIISLIVRYHFMISCLIFFSVYLSLQTQPFILAVLLYVKLYFNVIDPRAAKSSLTELYRQAKKDAKKGLTNSRYTFKTFKEKYQTSHQKEENNPDEQS